MDDVKDVWEHYKRQDKLFQEKNPDWDDLILHMNAIDEDSNVWKYIIKGGHQSTGKVKENSVVVLHYTVHVENAEDAVDSTLERESPLKVEMNQGTMLVGMEIGVLSMTKREIAVFIIEHPCAYGVKGSPPRIPAKARVMFTVEVLDFFKKGSADNILAMSEEDDDFHYGRKLTFKEIKRASVKLLMNGRRFWQEKEWCAASKCYRKGIKLLMQYSLKDEDEEQAQQHLLLKFYLNQANCGLKIMAPALTCVCCREALAIYPDCCKAMYRFGRAKLLLEDYASAIKLLTRALLYRPDDPKILKSLNMAYEEKRKRQEPVPGIDYVEFSFDDFAEFPDDDEDDEAGSSDSDRTICNSEDEGDGECDPSDLGKEVQKLHMRNSVVSQDEDSDSKSVPTEGNNDQGNVSPGPDLKPVPSEARRNQGNMCPGPGATIDSVLAAEYGLEIEGLNDDQTMPEEILFIGDEVIIKPNDNAGQDDLLNDKDQNFLPEYELPSPGNREDSASEVFYPNTTNSNSFDRDRSSGMSNGSGSSISSHVTKPGSNFTSSEYFTPDSEHCSSPRPGSRMSGELVNLSKIHKPINLNDTRSTDVDNLDIANTARCSSRMDETFTVGQNSGFVDMQIIGRRFVYDQALSECKYEDLTNEDIIAQWGTIENFGVYLRQVLTEFKETNKQGEFKTRIPLEVSPSTRQFMKRVVQDVDLRLTLRKLGGDSDGKLSFLI